MKKLFRWLLILGVAAGAVVAVTTLLRRRATAPDEQPWTPPVVEPPTDEPAEYVDLEEAEAAGEPAAAVVDTAAEAEPQGETPPQISPDDILPPPEQRAPLPTRDQTHDEIRSETEGMLAEHVDDPAFDSDGDVLLPEMPQAPEALGAEAILPPPEQRAPLPTRDETPDEIRSETEGMIADYVEDPALDSDGDFVLPEMPQAEPPAAEGDSFGAMMDEAVRAAEERATTEEAAAPEAQATPAEQHAAPAEAEPEKDFLTSYFEELAATPVAEEQQPATGAQLFESVEEALSDLEPAAIVPPPRRTAESYLDEGNVYFNVGQYGLAIERYTQAIGMDDSLTAAYYNRANARTRSGDFEGALADYDRALELQPADADALNNRGMLHLYRANYSAALADFNGALAADPTDTTVMVNRGLAHLHGGNASAALTDFQEAIRLDSSDAAGHYGAAQAAAATGNKTEALRYIQRTLELDPAYAREAAGDPRLESLQGDEEFLRLLRQSGSRSS